ncbi:MAG: ABC-2 family transporter protein [Thermomicrobiales bacterium]|nr:ABC-2 family transporter protein [Thermomicrobiales bacterium]
MTPAAVVRVLRRLTVMEITSSFMYRTQFVIYMISTVVSVLIGLMIWLRLDQSGVDLPVNREFIVSYYLMLAIVRVLTTTWHSEYLAMEIRNGRLNRWLIRPGSYLLSILANNFAEKLIKIIVVAVLLLPAAIYWRDYLVLPGDIGQWMLFLLALVLAAVIQFSLTTAIGSLGFWMDDNTGIARGRHVIGMVLTGELVPLVLFPTWAMGFLDWQPFRFMLSYPLEILLGTLSAKQVAYGFAMQFLWTMFFVWLCWFAWRRGLRSYSAIGA